MLNHFPAAEATLLTELGRLRADIAASSQGRARQLATEQAMIVEAAVIERAVIAHRAKTQPPNCIGADTTGAWWQAIGDHLRVVPVTDGRKTIAGPAPEPLLPVAACPVGDRPTASAYAGHKPTDSGCVCRGCRGVATSPFTVPVPVDLPEVAPMELTDEGPNYIVRSALDWAANVLDADEIGNDGCGSVPVGAGPIHDAKDC